ncbi:MAG: hypothetical protein V4760_15930 [Bdellovibrionota bacterium]
MEPAFLDSVVKAIGDTYSFFDSLQISVTALVVALVIVSFGFFFALREAATWFLKIDDLKSDVRRLRDLVLQMEGEVRVLQTLLTDESPAARVKTLEETVKVSEMKTAAVQAAAVQEITKAPKAFPINH